MSLTTAARTDELIAQARAETGLDDLGGDTWREGLEVLLTSALTESHLNDIEKGLSKLTGHKVFDDSIYYFDKIPTLVDPWTVAWIVGGALLISAVACMGMWIIRSFCSTARAIACRIQCRA